MSQRQPFPGDGPTIVTFETGAWQVHALESSGPNTATVIYEFGADGALESARPADSFWEWHRRLESEGTLDHNQRDCPHRSELEVQRWSRADGWRTVAVPVC